MGWSRKTETNPQSGVGWLTEGEVMSGGVDMSPKISSWLMFWQRDEIRGQRVRRRINRNKIAVDIGTIL